MSYFQILIIILIGLIAGFAGGSLGIGGGLIIVPSLMFIMGFSQHEAQGTSIAMMLAPIGILAAINYHKDPLKIKFTGNPFFSVIGEIKEMKRFYDDLPSHTKDILRYLKLLQEFLYPVEYKLLEDTYCYLVKNPTHANFEDCLNNLKNTGLIKREDRFILTWEPYLEKIVTTEDYPYLTFDLERLPNLFIKLKKAAILSHLISYFCAIKEFEKAIKYEKQMITIVAYDKYFLSYYNSGIILKELAEQKKDEKLYHEAFDKYKLAVKYSQYLVPIYLLWANTLYNYARVAKDKSKIKEITESCLCSLIVTLTHVEGDTSIRIIRQLAQITKKFNNKKNILITDILHKGLRFIKLYKK